MTKKLKKRRPSVQGQQIDDDVRLVLRRCALFYRASGYREELLMNEWYKALRWASGQKVKAKIYRAGPIESYRSICEQWIRNPKYLNVAGNPIALPAKGHVSIQSIMKDLKIGDDPTSAASALEKIGSVRRVGRNKFLLVQKMFRTRPDSFVAYETYSQFLAHAVKAATMPLHNTKSDRHSYWLTATRSGLTEREIVPFIQFVKRRAQPHMLEIDDSLNIKPKRNRQGRRIPKNTVGAGIFTFVTEPSSP